MRKILVLDAFTNGHEAALKFIRKMGWKIRECSIIFCGSHEVLIKRLTEGHAYGVVPVWNTIVNEISKVTNVIAEQREFGYDLQAVGELDLKINHCLLAPRHITKVSDLERVMSHEAAIQQCGNYLDEIGIPQDRRSKRDSTGNSAKVISKLASNVSIGAIASKSAARAYGLNILAENIQDVKGNFTKFQLIENKAEVRGRAVGIIGIRGREGTLFEGFFKSLGCRVIGSDEKNATGLSNEQVVQMSDVVFFALPIMSTSSVIKSLLKYFREDQLLMDVTSIKEPAVTAMLKSKAQVVGLHPMFAPETSFEGQTIAVCRARLDHPTWKTWVVNMLAATKCKIKWTTPEYHDMYMATVQASPHLANLVSAILIMEMGVSTKESLTFTSPFYRVMFSQMSRLLSQDPDLYSAIIMENPASIRMLRRRIQIERRMLKMMIKGCDRKSFRDEFLLAREHFGKDVTQEANELFLRLIAVTKTVYGKDSILLQCGKLDDKPGLLGKISRVFERWGVNLTEISSVHLDQNNVQLAICLGQSKTSDAVQKALETLELWKVPRVKIIG